MLKVSCRDALHSLKSLVHGFSAVCHGFLNVKAGIEQALQICEHFTPVLPNYYCHIMYFSLRLPISLSSNLCPFLFIWNTSYLYSSFSVHLCFLTLPLQSIPIPLAADTGRQSGYPAFCVNWFSQSMFQYNFILLSMPPILGLPLEADSKFLSVILRCEKWFTLSVIGPINEFCPEQKKRQSVGRHFIVCLSKAAPLCCSLQQCLDCTAVTKCSHICTYSYSGQTPSIAWYAQYR